MIINGNWYDDILSGTNLDDTISGYPAYGYGSGWDDYDGYDTLYGYAGNDSMYGGNQDDSLYGGDGNDVLYGGLNSTYSGNDSRYGGVGDDYLAGWAGNDRLDGYGTFGTEYDTLSGGTESDTFVLGGWWGTSYQGAGYATITDWEGQYDYIETVGSSSQYSLSFSNWSGTSALDTEINFGGELIAIVQDTTNVDIGRDFRFV